MERKCVQCGEIFILTDSEIEFYKSKGLSLPKRCKSCRDANRKTKAGMNKDNLPKNYNRDITVNSASQGSKKVYRDRHGRVVKPRDFIISLVIMFVLGLIAVGWNSLTSGRTSTDSQVNYSSYEYTFANDDLLISHFNKHGDEFGYNNPEEYLKGANDVINNPNSLHRNEAEDGDDCYYLQSTNEFVVVSPEGEIRTYFKPDDGIAYFNRQQKTVYTWFSRVHCFLV